MNVADMERRFFELKGKLDVDAISEDEFKSEMEKLRFQDAQERWWMIGAQSGKWYMYDGTRWIPGRPPEVPPATAEMLPDLHTSAQTTLSPQRDQPAASLRTHPALDTSQPVHTASLPTSSTSPRVPPPIFLLGGCAVLIGLVLFISLCATVETLVPGKPVSSAVGMIISVPSPTGQASASATGTPTRPAGATALPVAADGAVQLINAGDAFVLQSQFDPAIQQYQAAAQMGLTNPVPLVRWSRALAFQGQLQDALSKANQASQRAPNDALAAAQLARMQTWLGQSMDAVTTGERAVQLDPKLSDPHAFLAEAYLSARRTADAQTQAQLALQLGPTGAEAHRAQAWVLTIGGKKDAALAEWKQTVTLEPNLSFRHFQYAEALRVFLGDPANAAGAYRRALQLNGGYAPGYGRLGMALIAAGQSQQAIPQLQRAITLDPQNPANYAYLGVAFGLTNQCSQAIPYLEQALGMDANGSIATKALSECQSNKAVSVPTVAAPLTPLLPPALPIK